MGEDEQEEGEGGGGEKSVEEKKKKYITRSIYAEESTYRPTAQPPYPSLLQFTILLFHDSYCIIMFYRRALYVSFHIYVICTAVGHMIRFSLTFALNGSELYRIKRAPYKNFIYFVCRVHLDKRSGGNKRTLG